MPNLREDPQAAYLHATQNQRRVQPGCTHQLGCKCEPPHWVRCEWMLDKQRCCRGDGHYGPHEFNNRKEVLK